MRLAGPSYQIFMCNEGLPIGAKPRLRRVRRLKSRTINEEREKDTVYIYVRPNHKPRTHTRMNLIEPRNGTWNSLKYWFLIVE